MSSLWAALALAAVLLSSLLLFQPASAQSAACTLQHCTKTICISLADVSGFLSKIEQWFSDLESTLSNLSVSGLVDKLVDKLGNLLSQGANDAFKALGKVFNGISSLLSDQVFGNLADGITSLVNRLLGELNLSALFSNLLGIVSGGLSNLVNSLSQLGNTTLPQSVLNALGTIFSNIGSDLAALAAEFAHGLASLSGALGSKSTHANNMVSNAISVHNTVQSICNNPSSFLAKNAGSVICPKLKQLNADLANVEGALYSIYPLITNIQSSITSLPTDITSLQGQVTTSSVTSMLSGVISSCVTPSAMQSTTAGLMGLTSNLNILTSNLAAVAALVGGYTLSAQVSGTMSGTVTGSILEGLGTTTPSAQPVKTGSAQFTFTGTFHGPVTVTGTTVSGQITGTLSGTFTGPVTAAGFSGTVSGALTGIAAIGTVTGTYAVVNGVPTMTNVKILTAAIQVPIGSAYVLNTQTVPSGTEGEGFMYDGSILTLSASSLASPQPSVATGVLTSLGLLQGDVSSIWGSIGNACQTATLSADISECHDIQLANANMNSEFNAYAGDLAGTVLGPINTEIMNVNRFQGSINSRIGTLAKSIQTNPTIPVPAGVDTEVGEYGGQIASALGGISKTIAQPASDLTALGDNIIRLGHPLDVVSSAINTINSIVGNALAIKSPDPFTSTEARIIKGFGTACNTGVLNTAVQLINAIPGIGSVLTTQEASAACQIYNAFFIDGGEIQYDISDIQINVADIRAYDTQAGLWITYMSQDLRRIQSNATSISANLGTITGIMQYAKSNGNKITGAQCAQLVQSVTNMQNGVNRISGVVTNNLPDDVNGFIANINNAVQFIPQDISDIISDIDDIVSTVTNFVQTVSNALSSASGNNQPIPQPGICITVSYVVQPTTFGQAGLGCIVNANNLFIPIKVSVSGSVGATATAAASASQSFQAQLTGTAQDTTPGTTISVTGTVPVVLSGGTTVALKGTLTGYLSGVVSVPYSITNLQITGILTGTVAGTVSAGVPTQVLGAVGSGATATATGGSAGTGAAGSVSGGFSATVGAGASYTVTGTVSVSVTCGITVPSSKGVPDFTKVSIKSASCTFKLLPGHATFSNAGASFSLKLHGTLTNGVFTRNGKVAPLAATVDTTVSDSSLSLQTSSISLDLTTITTTNVQVAVQNFNPVDALVGGCEINTLLSAAIKPQQVTLAASTPQPPSTTIGFGQYTMLSATAIGGIPPYTFQWYSGASQTTCTSPIVGATSPTYIASPSFTTYYCYAVKDAEPNVQPAVSPAATVTVTYS